MTSLAAHAERTLPGARQGARGFHDRYFGVLFLAVAAYALTGKGFAYAGIAPIFPGEVILVAGLATLVWPRPSLAAFANPPSLLLVLLMAWTLLRTFPSVGTYGIDALRDSVIVMYGLFAFVTANLLLEDPARIDRAVRWAGSFFSLYGAVAAILAVAPNALNAFLPQWPGSGTPLITLRGGEVAVGVGAAAVFALLGLKRSSPAWVAMLVVAILLVSAQSRGGLLAIVVPGLLAVVVTGRVRAPALIVLAFVPIVATLALGDFEIPMRSEHRNVTVAQLVDNAASIFVSSNSSDVTLDATKAWRLRWWDRILGYTLHGPSFWTGKGFGVNLAVEDGFAGTGQEGPALRSPHSAHMTILARSGLPGLALWISVGAAWLGMMLRHVLLARRRGDDAWSRLLLFVLCDWLGCLIDASFDVALEGPMVGILFWVLFGAGTGLSMTYDALCRQRSAEQRAAGRAW